MSDDVRLRVLVADGHALKRAGMMYAVEHQPGLVVAGEAADLRTACQFLAEAKPDFVICNLHLPGDGLELLHAGRPLHPEARWVMVCPPTDAQSLQRVRRAGAQGVVLEAEGAGELLRALREVMAGRPFLSEKVSWRLLAEDTRRPARWEALLAALSDREWQVFCRLGRGMGVTAMAAELGLSVKTIETHERRIQEKLGLPGTPPLRLAAAEWSAAQGGQDNEPEVIGHGWRVEELVA
jgi:DNA-binding NarL/FixJ family response regulator